MGKMETKGEALYRTGDAYVPTFTFGLVLWLKTARIRLQSQVVNITFLVSLLCSAPSCRKAPDEVLCASDQYAPGHLSVAIFGKSDFGQTQHMLKGLFMDLGMPWDLGDMAEAKDTCITLLSLLLQ